MKYAEALKKVQAEKVKENHLIIDLSYSTRIVLPHKEGMAFLQALATAELLEDGYNKNKVIKEFERDAITFRIMSHAEYERHKMAALLGVSATDLESYAEKEKEMEAT